MNKRALRKWQHEVMNEFDALPEDRQADLRRRHRLMIDAAGLRTAAPTPAAARPAQIDQEASLWSMADGTWPIGLHHIRRSLKASFRRGARSSIIKAGRTIRPKLRQFLLHADPHIGSIKSKRRERCCGEQHPGFCVTKHSAISTEVQEVFANMFRMHHGLDRTQLIGRFYKISQLSRPPHLPKHIYVALGAVRFSRPRLFAFVEFECLNGEVDGAFGAKLVVKWSGPERDKLIVLPAHAMIVGLFADPVQPNRWSAEHVDKIVVLKLNVRVLTQHQGGQGLCVVEARCGADVAPVCVYPEIVPIPSQSQSDPFDVPPPKRPCRTSGNMCGRAAAGRCGRGRSSRGRGRKQRIAGTAADLSESEDNDKLIDSGDSTATEDQEHAPSEDEPPDPDHPPLDDAGVDVVTSRVLEDFAAGIAVTPAAATPAAGATTTSQRVAAFNNPAIPTPTFRPPDKSGVLKDNDDKRIGRADKLKRDVATSGCSVNCSMHGAKCKKWVNWRNWDNQEIKDKVFAWMARGALLPRGSDYAGVHMSTFEKMVYK